MNASLGRLGLNSCGQESPGPCSPEQSTPQKDRCRDAAASHPRASYDRVLSSVFCLLWLFSLVLHFKIILKLPFLAGTTVLNTSFLKHDVVKLESHLCLCITPRLSFLPQTNVIYSVEHFPRPVEVSGWRNYLISSF